MTQTEIDNKIRSKSSHSQNQVIEITAGSTYIFKGKKASNNRTYNKFKILEATDTTYLIKNIDAGTKFRCGIVDFNYDYKPIEVIETNEQIIDAM